jgi:predicted phosphodiesterase
MGSFEPTIAVPLPPADRLLAFHGSPRSNEDVLTPDSEPAATEPFRGTEAAVLAGGHTHTQWTRRIDSALFVNPGSVGLAYDRHQAEESLKLTPVAEYALLTAGDGAAAVEFRRVPYSLDELIAVTRESGRPHAETSIADWRPLGDLGAR